ncbi:MAG: hypothetical protein ACMUJM_15680 [bacterium]
MKIIAFLNIAGSKIWVLFWSFIFIIFLIYMGLVIVVRLFQSRFIYFPQREISLRPDRLGLAYEEVYFTSSDGIRLSG